MYIHAKKIAAVTAVCTVLMMTAAAAAGSIFSSRGIGLYSRFGNTRSMGMGGIGIGMRCNFRISGINPAGLYTLHDTRIALQLFSDLNFSKDAYASGTSHYANFDGFALAVPMGSGLGMLVEMSPLTRMDFSLASDHVLNGMAYTKSVEGSGGLNHFSLSLYWALHKYLSLSMTGSYNFGVLEETWKVDYENANFATSRDLFSYKNRGLGVSFGLMFHPVDNMEIGAVYTPVCDLASTADSYTVFQTEKTSTSGTLTLPSHWGAGVSYRFSKSVLAGLDYQARDWTRFEFHGSQLSGAVTETKISAGAEFFNSADLMDPFWKRMAFRVGLSFGPIYVDDMQGNSINERWLTLGVGIPSFLSISHLDISIAAGQRGSLETNGLSENIIRIGASITGGEKWFIRRY